MSPKSNGDQAKPESKRPPAKHAVSVHDFGLAIPIVFIAIKLTGVGAPISRQTADSLAHLVVSVWPSFGPQYEEFIRLGLVKDATYYALFYLCLFILLVYFTQKVVRWSFANSDTLKDPKAILLLAAILLTAPVVYVAAFWDTVRASPLRPMQFSIDPFGLYYIRQWAVFGSTMTFVVLVVPAAVKLAIKIHSRVFGMK